MGDVEREQPLTPVAPAVDVADQPLRVRSRPARGPRRGTAPSRPRLAGRGRAIGGEVGAAARRSGSAEPVADLGLVAVVDLHDIDGRPSRSISATLSSTSGLADAGQYQYQEHHIVGAGRRPPGATPPLRASSSAQPASATSSPAAHASWRTGPSLPTKDARASHLGADRGDRPARIRDGEAVRGRSVTRLHHQQPFALVGVRGRNAVRPVAHDAPAVAAWPVRSLADAVGRRGAPGLPAVLVDERRLGVDHDLGDGRERRRGRCGGHPATVRPSGDRRPRVAPTRLLSSTARARRRATWQADLCA